MVDSFVMSLAVILACRIVLTSDCSCGDNGTIYKALKEANISFYFVEMGEESKDVFWAGAFGYGCSFWNLFNFCHLYREGNRQALQKNRSPNQDVLINEELADGAIPIVILTEQPKSTYVHLENYTKESNSISLAMPQVDDPNLTIEPNKSECIVRDGKYFLVLVNLQQQELEKCCVVAQSHLGDISSDPSLEEAEGIVRSAIGKAKLLIEKKFCQFRELCQMNIDLNPLQKQITNQDLMGFWDLVQIQVDDLKKAFTKIEQLRMNGWQCPAKGSIWLPNSQKVPAFKPRCEPRKELLSLKATGRQMVRQNTSKDVVIFCSK